MQAAVLAPFPNVLYDVRSWLRHNCPVTAASSGRVLLSYTILSILIVLPGPVPTGVGRRLGSHKYVV